MPKKIKRILLLTTSIIFLILGVIGLFLPFLQGILFLAVGAILLSYCFPQFKIWLNEKTKDSPRVKKILLKAEEYIKDIIGEI